MWLALQAAIPHKRFRDCTLAFFAVLGVLSVVTISLYLGIWQASRTIRGPFATDAGGRLALTYATRDRACCLVVRTDRPGAERASRLRAAINGIELHPAHVPARDLQSGASQGFLHWDHLVYFRIPDSVQNDAAARLVLTFPIQASRPLFWTVNSLFLASALFIAACLFRLRWHRAGVHGSRGSMAYAYRLLCLSIATTIHFTVRFGMIFFSVLLAAYIGFTTYAWLAGQPLPVAFFFQNVPGARFFHDVELRFPLILLLLASALVAVSWLPKPRELADSIRRQEVTSIRLWHWCGLLAVAGIFFVFVASGSWAENVSYHDVPYLNMAGLVPHSDANNYFTGTRHFLMSGHIPDWNLRRPLSTVFRVPTLIIGGYTYVGTILTQIAALSIATAIATAAVIRWQGLSAGIAFLAMSFIMSRLNLSTTMSEGLALFWAFLSLPLFIYGLERRSLPHFSAGFGMLTIALFIRMGPMFVIPAIVLWVLLFFGSTWRQRVYNTLIVSLVIGAIVAANFVIIKLLGPPGAQLGSNYAQALCGMSIEGNWADCLRRYAEQVRELQGERAVANFLYWVTLQNVLQDPAPFIRSMMGAVTRFFSDLPMMPFEWYYWYPPPIVVVVLVYALAAAGWIYRIWARGRADVAGFAVLFALGFLASIPFTYLEDARRVSIALYPVIAMALAGGLTAPATVRPGFRTGVDLRKWAAATAVVIAIVLITWGILRSLHPEYQVWANEVPNLAADERIIAGNELQSGVLVVPNSSERPTDVPSMTLSKFLEFLQSAGIAPGQQNWSLPSSPFAFVNTHEWTYPQTTAYFLPPEVFRDKSVRRWKVKFVPRFPIEGWVEVVEATPIP